MRSAIHMAFLAVGLSVPLTAASAQVTHEHGGQPPEQLGKVHFPTSCNAQAQPRFERALALLHSFWWEESGVAFRQVAEADPSCLMAVWGQAMTLRNNPFAGEPPKPAQQAGWDLLERSAGMTGKAPGGMSLLGWNLPRPFPTPPEPVTPVPWGALWFRMLS